MSYQKLQALVNTVSKSLDDSEKLMVPVIFSKLKRCAELYPSDSTIMGIASVFNKFAEDKVFISKGEFKDLYNKFYSTNTKFAKLFEPELGQINNLIASKKAQSEPEQDVDVYSDNADPILSNMLESAFDKNLPLKLYDKNAAIKALKTVSDKLEACGIRATTSQVVNGNDKFIIVQSNYETPKGVTSMFIPLEVEDGKVSEPELFVGNGSFSDINYENIKNYIKANAGVKLTITSNLIIESLNKTAQHKNDYNIELAAVKVNAAKKANSEFHGSTILAQNVDKKPNKDVVLPKYAEASEFEQKLGSADGLAQFKFGDKVTIGKDLLGKELVSMGYKNPKIVVGSVSYDKIMFGVSLNSGNLAFTVPIKVGSRVEMPTVLISNGNIKEFSKKEIDKLGIGNSDHKVAAIASPQYGLKPDELIENINEAMAEGNVDKAEDALNVLAQTGNEKAYAIGFRVFASGLANPGKKEESKCNLVIKSASSQYPVCGHTNLPLHKVYQDEHGNCRPLYRKNQNEVYEGAFFMNSKIFG